MNIWKLSFKNMLAKPLNTALSIILFAMGIGLISMLIHVSHPIQEQMEKNIQGIDMVVGAKGSPLQLVLSAVFHIDAPTGNISYHEAERLKKNPLIEKGIPLSYGDSHKGYRIVGTEPEYAGLYDAKVQEGRLWETAFEASIGSDVAKYLGLKPGDAFTSSHGLGEEGEAHEEHAYKVVGIFSPSNSVIDQLILTATESVWEAHHHEEHDNHDVQHVAHREEGNKTEDAHRAHSSSNTLSENARETDHATQIDKETHHDHNPDEKGGHDHHHEKDEKEITAMLIKFRNPLGITQLPRFVNENTNMQAAIPSYEISRLLGYIGIGLDALKWIAIAIIIASAASLFISLYASLKERQYEMALMRVYGASPGQLAALILLEGLSIASAGCLAGFVLSRFGMYIFFSLVQENYHYELFSFTLLPDEVRLLLVGMSVGLIAALLPTINILKINISKKLSDV